MVLIILIVLLVVVGAVMIKVSHHYKLRLAELTMQLRALDPNARSAAEVMEVAN